VQPNTAIVVAGNQDAALRCSRSAPMTDTASGEMRTTMQEPMRLGRHRFVRPQDVEGVRALLDCSIRCAYDLTQPERDKVKADRKRRDRGEEGAGQSNRQIAAEVGLSHEGVRKITKSGLALSAPCGKLPDARRTPPAK
jgi:hypothetical protein